ncbi:TetR/AcrR family transcriptional regulator [Kribbella sp. NPDC056861]|uniref:TetR/AcrR family transcriptional regulator n=1 Tax=Kribbella sp. NPDC056861 TaxID=3154857 RepID=UPI00341CDDFB
MDGDVERRRVLGGRRRGLVEREIRDCAARLFAAQGIGGTSLQDIATAVGISRPALYHYVKSKNELLVTLILEVTATAGAELAAIAGDDGSAVSRLRRLVTHSAGTVAADPDRFRLLVGPGAELPEQVARQRIAWRQAVLAAFELVIRDGVTAGEFRPLDPTTAALSLFGLCTSVAWWFQPGTNVDIMTTTLTEMAAAALLATPDRVRPENGPVGAIDRLRAEIDHLEIFVRNAGNHDFR